MQSESPESYESHESPEQRDYPLDCYYCNEIFDGIGKKEYDKHMISRNPHKSAYPGPADIKLYSLIPKEMSWEI